VSVEYCVRPIRQRCFGVRLPLFLSGNNETALETSYKFQLSQNFSLTPDVQVVFNPANDPSKATIWVVGLRAIFSL